MNTVPIVDAHHHVRRQADLDDAERAAVFEGAAGRVYRLRGGEPTGHDQGSRGCVAQLRAPLPG